MSDFKVWYTPQVPMKAFEVRVPDLETARIVEQALYTFSLFEYENNVKPDYSDAGGVMRWDGSDWYDVEGDE